MNNKIRMYEFKQVLYDNKVFVIYRHEQDRLGVFLFGVHNEIFGLHTLKFVCNTKQCRDVIKNYKNFL